MAAHIGDAKWAGRADQLAEDSPARRQGSNLAARRFIDAKGQKPSELVTGIVENPQRGVAGTREVASGLQHPSEYHFQIKLFKDAAGDAENAFGG